MARGLTLLFILLFLLAGPARAGEVLVSGAASLTEPLRQLAAEFETSHPQTRVLLNVGATGALEQQIIQGAPVHLFAGAAAANVQKLAGLGLLAAADGVTTLCRNTLVLTLRPGLKLEPENPGADPATTDAFAVLLNPAIRRVAVGDPHTVPAGKYAEELLRGRGLFAAVQPRLIYAEHVRQALAWVQSGDADAALVYATDVLSVPRSKNPALRIAAASDPAGPPRIAYAIALTRRGGEQAEARALFDFITGPAGARVLKACGFLPPTGGAP